eukprot:m51a1_g6716 hypothetical protein (260) ;mRNA; r:136633-148972
MRSIFPASCWLVCYFAAFLCAPPCAAVDRSGCSDCGGGLVYDTGPYKWIKSSTTQTPHPICPDNVEYYQSEHAVMFFPPSIPWKVTRVCFLMALHESGNIPWSLEEWTDQETCPLLEAVEQTKGGDWNAVAQHVGTKTKQRRRQGSRHRQPPQRQQQAAPSVSEAELQTTSIVLVVVGKGAKSGGAGEARLHVGSDATVYVGPPATEISLKMGSSICVASTSESGGNLLESCLPGDASDPRVVVGQQLPEEHIGVGVAS